MVYPFPRPFPGPSILKSFSVLSLFSSGEQGAWYDPSDFSTMFQDSAGTTPVTAVEQPVGLLLDKSKGLVLGSELVTNGNFATDSDWTKGAGWTISGGSANYDGTDAPNAIYQTAAVLASGKSYRVSLTVVLTQGALLVRPLFNATAGQYQINSSGTYSILLSGQGGSFGLVAGSSGGRFIGSVDNISVRELPGNHASQSTAASRPVLSARVNTLEYSQEFSNAYWTKSSVTVAQNTGETTDPLGGNTAAKYTATAVSSGIFRNSVATAGTWNISLSFKAGNHSTVGLLITASGNGRIATFDLSAQTASIANQGTGGTVSGGTPSLTSLGNGWFRCTITGITTSGTNNFIFGGSGGNGETFYIWGADLRVTNVGVNLPAYQRVAAATDYDTTGFPLYLRADGVDDRLIGPAISNLVSASAYEACVGARVLAVSTSNASPWLNQTLLADSLGYVGVGYMTTSNIIGGFNFDGSADTVTQAMTPPSTFVLQQRHDGGNLVLSLNGGSEASAASGNTSNITGDARIFSSNGSLSVQSHLYGLIIRSTAFTATERANVLTYVNNLTKAY